MNDSTSNGTSLGNGKILPDNATYPPKHRPLTLARQIRGIGCLVIITSTAFFMMVYWAPVTTILLRLFSVHYSRRANAVLFGAWLSLWPFLFEKINKTKVVFSCEQLPSKERVLLFANHRTEVDWMYLWDLALRKGRLGYIKYILKSSLMKLPVFGWAFQCLEFIPVERKWEIDEPIIRRRFSTFKDPQDPLWLALFPEGTDYTEKKCVSNQEYAIQKGLPVLRNVLLPKTKGFNICLELLRPSLDAVYDVTMAYKHRCPNFLDNVFGVDPSEVHIHTQRILPCDIPLSEAEASAWLIERFRLKDELLANFASDGHFPNEGSELDLSLWHGLTNFFAVVGFTAVSIYLTFFASIWFKIYVALSCIYLVAVTRYSVLPPQLFSSKSASIDDKKTL